MRALDIIYDAFQRQQGDLSVIPAEDGESIFDCFTPSLCPWAQGRVFPVLNAPTILMEVKSKNAQRKSSV